MVRSDRAMTRPALFDRDVGFALASVCATEL
jgi:hypothetical protein